ncbi:Gfo/Idh/MocA family protein [Leifsonia sp. 21MFCrub1.1]|uniref:Gfo/Idh/MocA family protein n=1 Tax=Leifsonia sp. 21MFCrub1.1 TaxID=1798223 RepID=UPI0008928917|nr:Gfo/Idh/MocA family oxidoreductase [Leifsonia sp. 21MFCrub1.1]SEB07651.1 myo-inositol 2-dehydrogenase / D-chiro-inositol 1-dehydrogenase [Leifsonia sp. 21MFCrub1.1]
MHRQDLVSTPPLTVALIGAGGISQVHAPAWKALGAHVLVFAHAGAEQLAERFGLEVAPSLEDALARASIVDIVTPTSAHAEIALAAIERGLDIICEKPLTLTAASSRELAATARAAGVQIYPAHVVRFTAPYETAHRAIESGSLGRVAVARYFREASSPAIGTWFQDQAASGGPIMDLMLHDLDQARWNAGEVETVYAVQNPPTVDGVIPSFVSAHVTLTHSGGAISHLHATWAAVGTRFKTGFSIAGTEGTISYSSLENTGLTAELPGATATGLTIPDVALRESPYLAEIREFAAAFAGGPEPRVTAEDGAIAVSLAEAALQSLETGEVVRMADFAPEHTEEVAA